MSTGIRVACLRCSQQVDSSQRHSSGLCGLCLVRDEVGPILAEYSRLWLKRLRWRGPLASIDRQLLKLSLRVNAKVHARIAHQKTAVELINRLLTEAREQAIARGSRIRIPAAGDLVAAR